VNIKLGHAVGNKLRIFHQLRRALPLDRRAGGQVGGPLPAAEEGGVRGREVRVLPGLLAAGLQAGAHLNIHFTVPDQRGYSQTTYNSENQVLCF